MTANEIAEATYSVGGAIIRTIKGKKVMPALSLETPALEY